jgi:glycosyltransferase involved in cell wall biosynthesis
VRILFVTMESPLDPDRGARVRDHELIRRVAEHHEVMLLPVLARGQSVGDDRALASRCEVLSPVTVDDRPHAATARAAGSIRQRRPLASLPYVNDLLLNRLRRVVELKAPDLVQIEHSFLAPCLDVLPAGSHRVLSLHNVGLNQYASMARAASTPGGRAALRAKAWLCGRLERSYLPRFDRVIVVSELERRILPPELPPGRVAVVPNGVDLQRLQPLPEPDQRHTLLFVGNLAYPPNVAAVLEFAKTALPILRRRLGGVELTVVGPEPPAAVRRLASGAVSVVGRVADVEPSYAGSRVVIVPLRAGGGTRLKVLEAMAYGRCVISTATGVEGLAVEDRCEVLLAPPGRAFADRVEEALRNDELRRDVARRGRALVEREHSWDVSAAKLLDVYEQLRSPALSGTA